VLWQVGSALQDLHVGGVGSWANDVNNNGQIVGHGLDHIGRQFGFLWQAGSSVGLSGLTTHPNAAIHFFTSAQSGHSSALGFFVGMLHPHWIGQATASGRPSLLVQQRIL